MIQKYILSAGNGEYKVQKLHFELSVAKVKSAIKFKFTFQSIQIKLPFFNLLVTKDQDQCPI